VCCDPSQLESALLNLAINARDAMLPDGGRLTIETAHAQLRQADVADWDGAEPGDYVRITVSDTGTGMPPDVLAHAFEPFFTTKPDGQGTGLGLSQLYGFVRQSQGVVRLDSRVGLGTSVHLYLARSHDMPGDPGHADVRPDPSRAVFATTVLLVDDEEAVRAFAAEALRDLGYRVLEAAHGHAGLAALRKALGDSFGNAVDLLVTDVGLPSGLNGRQLADAARMLVPDLPVLLITGYAGDAISGQGQLPPGMAVLRKPFDLDALADRVQGMIGRARGG
jgi:CheY-like chemotaxis protein